jgi:4-hydroxybenzoate polyprenyltransferase
MMFLVPYMLQRPLDARGAVLAMVFALAFASGHANHEVMDRQADAAAGVRTTAVVLGARWVHGYGTVLALLAYVVAAGGWAAGELVWQEAVPFVVLGATHVAVGVYRFVRTLETRTARQYRRIYRVVFAAATVLTVLGHLSILVRGGG